MQKRKSDEKGFTLIEAIFTLLLVGLMATLAGMWLVSVASGYIFTKMNANTVQKGQLAMTRLTKELSAIQSISVSSGTSITFIRADTSNPSTGVSVTVSQSADGRQLLINNNPLTDGVSSFSLNYCDGNLTSPTCSTVSWATIPDARIIEVTLTLMGANNTPSTFKTRATPRNI